MAEFGETVLGSPARKHRSVMETELTEKGCRKVLPQGLLPVIYFPVSTKKKAEYQVEYVSDGKKLFSPFT
jgi:hypothetical protein